MFCLRSGTSERLPPPWKVQHNDDSHWVEDADGNRFGFHNRQPVVLDRAGAATWLDVGEDYGPLLKGPPGGTLVADPPEPVAA